MPGVHMWYTACIYANGGIVCVGHLIARLGCRCSHLVFSILIESTNTVTGKVITGKLSLVDLAGSERLKKTRIDATGVEVHQSPFPSIFADALAAGCNCQSGQFAHFPAEKYCHIFIFFYIRSRLSPQKTRRVEPKGVGYHSISWTLIFL